MRGKGKARDHIPIGASARPIHHGARIRAGKERPHGAVASRRHPRTPSGSRFQGPLAGLPRTISAPILDLETVFLLPECLEAVLGDSPPRPAIGPLKSFERPVRRRLGQGDGKSAIFDTKQVAAPLKHKPRVFPCRGFSKGERQGFSPGALPFFLPLWGSHHPLGSESQSMCLTS